MKSKKVNQNQSCFLKQEKEISSYKQAKAIKKTIQLKREDMKRLIAFAVGEKSLLCKKMFLARTQKEDERLLWSLRQLREQVHDLEQALLLLQEESL